MTEELSKMEHLKYQVEAVKRRPRPAVVQRDVPSEAYWGSVSPYGPQTKRDPYRGPSDDGWLD